MIERSRVRIPAGTAGKVFSPGSTYPSFMWHQSCWRCKYTTSVEIQKTRYKKLVIHVEPHATAISLFKRVENSAI